MLVRLFRLIAQSISYSNRRLILNLSSGLAGLLYLAYRCSPYRSFIASNLQQALPELSPAERKRLSHSHLRLLLWAIIDLLRFWRFQQQPQLPPELQIQGWQHFEAAYQAGKGVILVSAHYGCWELIPATLSLKGYPTTVLVQKPTVDGFDQLFREFRSFAGVKTLNNDTLAGLRPLLKALRQGEVVGLVVDQHGESQQLIGKFFGHSVSLPEGPAYLAQHLGAPLLPVLIRWQGQQHLLEFFEPLWPQSEQPPQQAPLKLMQQIYDWLESQIRAYPENWLWTYNRWDKYRP